jgi:hypothetical protein
VSEGLRRRSLVASSVKPAAVTSCLTVSSSIRWSVSQSRVPLPAAAL